MVVRRSSGHLWSGAQRKGDKYLSAFLTAKEPGARITMRHAEKTRSEWEAFGRWMRTYSYANRNFGDVGTEFGASIFGHIIS
jgi:hypothetical protein